MPTRPKNRKIKKTRARARKRTEVNLVINLFGHAPPVTLRMSAGREFASSILNADGSVYTANASEIVLTKENAIALLLIVVAQTKHYYDTGQIDIQLKNHIESTLLRLSKNINKYRRGGEKVAILNGNVYPKVALFQQKYNIPSAISIHKIMFDILRDEVPVQFSVNSA